MAAINIPFNINDTINRRRSVRSFKPVPIKRETLDLLSEFINNIKPPFNYKTEIRLFKSGPGKKLYPTMRSPIDNVAFLSETDIISVAKTGFIGELVILMAESLGISTCWYGHYRLEELEKRMPHLQNHEQLKEANEGYGYSKGITQGIRAICISPLGYYQEKGLRMMDRITRSVFSFKRKEIKELLETPNDIENVTEDVHYALDLARKAPSAANSQMWRFSFENDYRSILVAMPSGYGHFKWEHPNVDIGICACHLWLGLIDRNYNPDVEVIEDNGRAIFKISF